MMTTADGVMGYISASMAFPNQMRAAPTVTIQDNDGNAGKVSGDNNHNIAGRIVDQTQDYVACSADNVVIAINTFMYTNYFCNSEL
jgi:hypothetical protein